jgi:hypothetical protein
MGIISGAMPLYQKRQMGQGSSFRRNLLSKGYLFGRDISFRKDISFRRNLLSKGHLFGRDISFRKNLLPKEIPFEGISLRKRK